MNKFDINDLNTEELFDLAVEVCAVLIGEQGVDKELLLKRISEETI